MRSIQIFKTKQYTQYTWNEREHMPNR